MLKTGEAPRNNVATSDDLSAVDLGYDFVKEGEKAQIGRGK